MMENTFIGTEEKGWYTIGELAKKIQVSDRTVWSWIRDGKLRSTRYGQCPASAGNGEGVLPLR
jgi:hypothetical protein